MINKRGSRLMNAKNNLLDNLYKDIKLILHTARKKTYNTINSTMIEAYWKIGQRIVEEDQEGKSKAEYGAELIKNLSKKLGNEFGKGFSVANQTPKVRIFTPQGSTSEEALVFSGSAFDLEDGLITPGQLTWISDQDGILGTGYTLSVYLSPGMHQITLQMIDSRGAVGKDIRAINAWRVFLPIVNR